jgi:hypothetical protein
MVIACLMAIGIRPALGGVITAYPNTPGLADTEIHPPPPRDSEKGPGRQPG